MSLAAFTFASVVADHLTSPTGGVEAAEWYGLSGPDRGRHDDSQTVPLQVDNLTRLREDVLPSYAEMVPRALYRLSADPFCDLVYKEEGRRLCWIF